LRIFNVFILIDKKMADSANVRYAKLNQKYSFVYACCFTYDYWIDTQVLIIIKMPG